MMYLQQQAHQKLKDEVRCYWKLENNSNDFQSYTILPDGFFDLLICYNRDQLEEVLLSGLWNQKTNVIISPETTIYGIQFRLLAIENIIQESIASSLNHLRELEHSSLGLNEFVKTNDADFFNHLDHRLITRKQEKGSIDSRKSILLTAINETKGSETVEYYSQKAYWSSRQINRYFQATFGLSLKTYCTIRKGAATYSQIKKGQLYPRQGYFDQSHFIKGIKNITGFTPKTLRKNEDDRFLQFSIIKSE